ncbi:putative membrane protein [Synechococcus sp. SYN20]|nr:putative membrane protein [Synechococcus sp. SYN20]
MQKLLVLLPLFSVAVKSFGFLLAHRKCLKVLFSQKVYFNILLFVFGYSFIA